MQRKEILFDQKKISCRILGTGPAVVLLHGFGEDGSIWKNQYNALPGFQLIIPDLPGSGDAEMISDMSMEGLAAAIHHLLKALNVADCIMIGHSMGGYVALAFAEKYPDLLKGLGLFHSTAYADSEEKKTVRKKGIAFIEEHGAFAFLRTSIPGLYAPATREHHTEIIEDQLKASHNFSAAALVSYYLSMMHRPNRIQILKMIQLPVLFILGKYDAAVPLKDGLEQCFLPELSYIHILEDSGHMGMIEEKDKSNIVLHNYLNSLYHLAR